MDKEHPFLFSFPFQFFRFPKNQNKLLTVLAWRSSLQLALQYKVKARKVKRNIAQITGI
jgi:hypothetical protein